MAKTLANPTQPKLKAPKGSGKAGKSAGNGAEGNGSNMFAKVVIGLLFLIALGEAGAAVALEWMNRQALQEIVPAEKMAKKRYDVKTIEPNKLRLWEKAQVSERMEGMITDYLALRAAGEEFIGENRATNRLRSIISDAARELGIPTDALDTSNENSRRWQPPRDRRDLREWKDRFQQSSLQAEFPSVEYRLAVQLADKLQQENPWLKVTALEITRLNPPRNARDRNPAAPGQPVYRWQCDITVSWWQELAPEEDD